MWPRGSHRCGLEEVIGVASRKCRCGLEEVVGVAFIEEVIGVASRKCGLEESLIPVLYQVSQLREKLCEAESSREKLRGIIRKLKEDRTHYRTLADQTQ